MTREERRLRLFVDDQIENRYLEVPFELPAGGTPALEVTLAYNQDAAVIDLGCRDPERWRGWSGGARSRFVIAPDAATPGYEPGELVAGQWAVVLGLHAMPAEPVDVTVTVSTGVDAGEVEDEPPAPPPPSGIAPGRTRLGRDLPAPDGLTWYAGDLHAHTTHSDGTLSIAQLTAAAAGRGLDFLAVTDHNTVSHHPHLPAVGAAYDLCLLPGQEVTTHAGHANAFGDIGWVDFRRPAAQWLSDVEERGGLLSVNHPVQDDCGWLYPVRTGYLELWHISWFLDLTATGPWAYLRALAGAAGAPGATERPVFLGGSDFHTPDQGYPPGTPTTWVAAEDRTPEAILDAVRHGRTAISRFPGPGEPVLVRVGEDLVAIDADGTVLVDSTGLAGDRTAEESTRSGGTGRRRRIRGDRVTLVAPPEHGPYRLEAPDRTLLAISV
ncbi:CehA/McbA family metallohydrolase [Promicromonospora panici]|uniref:CehA/McbA family metallohydrolase n=1 Tax=Promicromonospora panici TaxID=2219658 RepID=UPI001A91B700|nr:CehA/McbA family metallohydrolase [Promicromonospora panici]